MKNVNSYNGPDDDDDDEMSEDDYSEDSNADSPSTTVGQDPG